MLEELYGQRTMLTKSEEAGPSRSYLENASRIRMLKGVNDLSGNFIFIYF